MFCDYEEIKNKLKCPQCKQAFVECVKILPCGNSICDKCENKFISCESQAQAYTCPVCLNKHEVVLTSNRQGLPINLTIQHLLSDLKPIEIYRGETYENCTNLIETIKGSIKEYEQKLDRFQINLKTHYDFIRNEVDIITESKKQLLNEARDEILNEINEYELGIDSQLTNDNAHTAFLYDLDTIEAKLKQPNITNAQIKGLICQANGLNEKFQVFHKTLSRISTDKRKLTFIDNDETLERKQLGALINDSEHVLYKIQCLKSQKPFVIDYSFIEQKKCIRVLTAVFQHTNDLVLAINTKGSEHIIDKYTELILYTNSTNYTRDRSRKKIIELCNYLTGLTCCKQCIVIGFESIYEDNKYIKMYTKDFKRHKEIQIDYTISTIEAMSSDSSNIFVLSNKTPILHVYNEELELVHLFGQCDVERDWDYITENSQIKCANDFLYICNSGTSQSVQILSKSDFSPIKSINIENFDKHFMFNLLSMHTYLFVQPYDRELCLFNDIGKNIFNIKLNNIAIVSSCEMFYEKCFILNDMDMCKIHFYLFNT